MRTSIDWSANLRHTHSVSGTPSRRDTSSPNSGWLFPVISLIEFNIAHALHKLCPNYAGTTAAPSKAVENDAARADTFVTHSHVIDAWSQPLGRPPSRRRAGLPPYAGARRVAGARLALL